MTIHLYGLILGIAIVISLNYFEKNNTTIPKSKVNIFIFGLLISILIGARTYHVIDTWYYYSQNLSQIINIPNGGLGIYGALIAATIFIYIFARLNKISVLSITNSFTPILPLAQSIGRFGNFVNGEIPIWWLESLLCFILFLIIKKLKSQHNPTGLYLLGYGIIRFITEQFRTDTWMVNNFHIANAISLILIIWGIILLKKCDSSGKSLSAVAETHDCPPRRKS